MKKGNRYLFSAALAGVALGGINGIIHKAEAALVTAADFTFDSNSAAASSNASSVSYLADIGTGTAYGVHAAASSFTFSSGNGSFSALSGNKWAVNDYFKFAVPTSLIDGVVLSFDEVSSGTGPGSFELAYSTDGSSFSSYSSYAVIKATSNVSYNATYDGTVAASAGSTQNETIFSNNFSASAFNYTFDLSGITGLNANPNAAFELINLTLAGSTAGTDRIDNFIVAGTAVPEPATVSLLTIASAGILLRRRTR